MPTLTAPRTYSVGSATADGQRFRVLRPHARGGLGAVFVALDAELNREVALKQILDQHADDPASRQRFLLEAEITGGLEHPGIVPVYGLGTTATAGRTTPCGSSAATASRRRSSASTTTRTSKTDPGRRSLALRKLLRRFVDVCNAIDYAHSRGVLHRDIKPANIIVGKHGETLVVDWGLAKAIGQVGARSRRASGPLVPPLGQRHRRDAARLGAGHAGLHEPRAGRGRARPAGPRQRRLQPGRDALLPADRHGRRSRATTSARSSERSRQGDFPPPREVDPSIDRALEAVCLKAMALKPEDRYASCRALADDVERWMADEPVSAYRDPGPHAPCSVGLQKHRTAVAVSRAICKRP